mgnify:CR=1 FL=1
MLKKMIKLDKAYYLLASIVFIGVLLAFLFLTILKRLFHMVTWKNIKELLGAFRSCV